MTQITFPYSSKEVRVVMIDDAPWFVAADVLSTLTLDRKALERLDDDEKDVNTIHTPGGNQDMTIINESGLYSLILTSRKAEAKKFKKWVTAEVLPAIRKTGRYEMQPASATQENITPDQLRQLNDLVHEIMMCCHFQDKANHNLYAGIRDQYGLSTINDLPSIHYEQVYAVFLVLREKAREYLKLRCRVDELFIKEVLRLHKMQLPIQADLFLSK